MCRPVYHDIVEDKNKQSKQVIKVLFNIVGEPSKSTRHFGFLNSVIPTPENRLLYLVCSRDT
jgi:hypothetical protein